MQPYIYTVYMHLQIYYGSNHGLKRFSVAEQTQFHFASCKEQTE